MSYPETWYHCKYCHKAFNQSGNRTRHEKQSCPTRRDFTSVHESNTIPQYGGGTMEELQQTLQEKLEETFQQATRLLVDYAMQETEKFMTRQQHYVAPKSLQDYNRDPYLYK